MGVRGNSVQNQKITQTIAKNTRKLTHNIIKKNYVYKKLVWIKPCEISGLEYKGSIFLLSQSFSRFPGMKIKKLEKIPTPDDRSMVKGI
jgi:hypothetical protein